MTSRLGLGDLLAAGPRAVSRYTGTLFAVFVAQMLVATICTLSVTIVLAKAFAHVPMFDDAVDGDLVALVYCLRYGAPSLAATAGLVLGAVLLWQLAAWFLAGGLYGVLAHRPEGRRDTEDAYLAALFRNLGRMLVALHLPQARRSARSAVPADRWPCSDEEDAAAKEEKRVKALLKELGLMSYALLTGGKGIHVVAPIAPDCDWPVAEAFAKGTAERLADRAPERYTTNLRKAARDGRIFIDWLRNQRGSTAIVPWSTRAKPSASVAVPVSWDELRHVRRADAVTIRNARRHFDRDPWAGFFQLRQSLTREAATMLDTGDA